jgi:branched-chain amino acid transport system permease protein
MSSLIESALNGIFLGALYAMIGLGLSIGFGVMNVVNLGHGDFMILAAMMSFGVSAWLKIDALTTLVIVVPAMAVLGYFLQRFVLSRTLGSGPLPPLLTTFGMSIVLQNVMQEIFTADTRVLPSSESLSGGSIDFRGVSVGLLPLLTALVAVGVFVSLELMLRKTSAGRILRATSDDRSTVRLMGVSDGKVFAYASALVFALIALAAVFYGVRAPFTPTSGPERLLFAFEAVVMGGLGSMWGTLLGGVVLGLAQMLGEYLHTGYGPFAGHVAFFVALLALPNGIFGRSAK